MYALRVVTERTNSKETRMSEAIKVIAEQNVLGKEFSIYGTIEEPLFLAKDVAEWIEHSDVHKMLQSVDDDEKGRNIVPTPGGEQECWFLTENGLYEVLMLSRKPIAKKFKKEVKRILHDLRLNGTVVSAKVALSSPEEQALSFQKALDSALKHAFEIADNYYKPQLQQLNREKAWISEKREATALQRNSVLKRRINTLEREKQEMMDGYDAEIDELRVRLAIEECDASRYRDWRSHVGRKPKGWLPLEEQMSLF